MKCKTKKVFVSYNACIIYNNIVQNVLHFNLFPMLRDCSPVASPTHIDTLPVG